jgi:hypothetical protein
VKPTVNRKPPTIIEARTFGALLRPSLLIVIAALAAPCAPVARAQSSKHSISVTFDYDFTSNHACSPTVTTNCLAQFNVYDISSKPPTKLFSIPAPAGASGPVKGVTGESQPLLFESGKHLLAVRAQMASGKESKKHACEVWIEIP